MNSNLYRRIKSIAACSLEHECILPKWRVITLIIDSGTESVVHPIQSAAKVIFDVFKNAAFVFLKFYPKNETIVTWVSLSTELRYYGIKSISRNGYVQSICLREYLPSQISNTPERISRWVRSQPHSHIHTLTHTHTHTYINKQTSKQAS